MARFDAPYPGNEKTKNSQWSKVAPLDMRSPDHLWGECWQRFNTFCIPLFDKEEYFRTAMALAKDSKSKKDFERRFEEENKRRLKILRSGLKKMCRDIKKAHPTRAAHTATFLEETHSTRPAYIATSHAQDLTCLEHFSRLLNGYILDRKADMASPTIVVENQSNSADKPLQERGLECVEDETSTLIGEASHSPSDDPEYEEYLRTKRIPDEWGSQLGPDIDWSYESNKEHRIAQERYRESDDFFRTNIEPLTSAFKDAASHALISDDDAPSIQQVPSLVSNDSQDLEEENETTTHDGQRRRSSFSFKSSSTNSAKKRARFDDDEDISTHEPKRRKLESTLAHAETSPTPQTIRASSLQAANGSASRKRSRADEDEEDDGFKRQKIESVPRPPSLVPIASSTEDDLANHLAQGSSEKVLEEQILENNNSGRKRRKQKPTTPTLRATSSRNILNTRSSRRAKSSTLWELDALGKPRST